MGKTIQAAKQEPTIVTPDNSWRPIITQLEQPSQVQSRSRRRSGIEARQQRDVPIDTILNDRLG